MRWIGSGLGSWGPLGGELFRRTLSGLQAKLEGNTVSDLMLKFLVAMQRRTNDKGQTAVEYLGIIAVVVAIVLAVTGTSIGQSILQKILSKINEIT